MRDASRISARTRYPDANNARRTCAPTNPEAPVKKTRSGANGRAERFAQRSRRADHGGRLVAAMRHAIVARFVLAAAVFRPVGFVEQLLIRLGVAFFAHQIARPLPAEDGVARNTPRGALKIDLA